MQGINAEQTGVALPMVPDGAVNTTPQGVEGAAPGESGADVDAELHKPRACYICKRRFLQLHHFYDR